MPHSVTSFGRCSDELDALYGPIYHRLLVPYENIELSDSYIDHLLDAVFVGVAPA